ncbi:MAG: glutaminyl-peptide cyclotransferase [Bacteroidota bacterium]
MKFHKLFILIVLLSIVMSCGNESEDPNDYFDVSIENSKKYYKTTDQLEVSLTNKKNKEVENVVISLDGVNKVTSQTTSNHKISLKGEKMGARTLEAIVTADGKDYKVNTEVIITASKTPSLYTYKILESYPHDINAFTQGLEFENDTLYEGTGQYKESTLRKTNYKTGEVLQSVPLADQYFGEGITILNDKIYQLTWRRKTGFIYDLNTLEETQSFVYGKSAEGWGLCNDGTTIYKSDGTERIWKLNASTLAEEGYIEVYTNTSRIPKLNELEWVNGKIYANLWDNEEKSKGIAIIDPSTGAVEGVINLRGLVDEVTQHEKLNILNGIAYNGEENILYVTGKNWDKLFKIEIVEQLN